MFKKILAIVPAAMILVMPVLASAHVVVTPGEVAIGARATFSVSVPNEAESPVVSLKLDIPEGVTDITPTVKPGWTIETTKSDTAADKEVTAVTWTGGAIPAEQRDDFTFKAQVPAKTTELNWKAYQTYGDGTVVHWDQKPAGDDDSEGDAGPYSVTRVVNDLDDVTPAAVKESDTTVPLVLSVIAIVIAAGSILFKFKS